VPEYDSRFNAFRFALLALCLFVTTCGGGNGSTNTDIVVDATKAGARITRDQLGAGLAVYFRESSSPELRQLLKNNGIGMLRWPGGSVADSYHWRTNEYFAPQGERCSPVHSRPEVQFDRFMQGMVVPGGFDLNITVNYGSNPDCTGGGSADEAADWVRHSNVEHNYGVKYWSIGNEQYFNEKNPTTVDLNTPPHDANEYARRVATEFYPKMKAADPSIKIGVNVVAGTQPHSNATQNWDAVVLAKAKYDFVELHFYPDIFDDDRLLREGPEALATALATLRKELADVHRPQTPIYLGEFGSDTQATKQTVSIVGAMFIGMAIGEITKADIPMATVYQGVDDCTTGNEQPDVYGWQDYGSHGMYTSGEDYNRCPTPVLNPFPKARAFEVARLYAVPGQRVLDVTSTPPSIRAYAATSEYGGYAFMLFNLDRTHTAHKRIVIEHTSVSRFEAFTTTYGKAQYDESRNNTWAGPVSRYLGVVTNPVTVELPPWSMTVIIVRPLAN
jgi:hypothetical protein